MSCKCFIMIAINNISNNEYRTKPFHNDENTTEQEQSVINQSVNQSINLSLNKAYITV